jgi:hypothetical protein
MTDESSQSPGTNTDEETPSTQISLRTKFAYTLRMGISLLLFIVVWVLFVLIIPAVTNEHLVTVLRGAIVLIAGFLPAIIFGYFQSRRQILFIEYKQNLRRLGFTENAQIYRNKFNAIYGNSDMFDRQDIVFQTPIIIATI